MATASLRAQIADLLGFDERDETRPTVAEAVSRCQPGAVIPARDGDREVAIVGLADGRIYCMADRCPHDGGPLSDGFVEDDQIVCARHGRTFDPTDPPCPSRGGLVDARLVRPGRR
jgi:nitrite reductase/ring-hydroxylating ferredoxin subunit